MPLPIIKDILGHASIQTTQVYTHTDVEKEREAITGITNYLDLDLLKDLSPLRGANKRMKFAALNLPDFSVGNKASD